MPFRHISENASSPRSNPSPRRPQARAPRQPSSSASRLSVSLSPVRLGRTVSGQSILSTILRQNTGSPASSPRARPTSQAIQDRTLQRFTNLLSKPEVPLNDLRKLSWSGVAGGVRARVWLLLSGVLPTAHDRIAVALQKRVKGYLALRQTQYSLETSERTSQMQTILRQIKLDVPRTHPGVELFQHPAVQKALERILFVWAVRNPATGYVQGINDLVSPLLLVFLAENFDGCFDRIDVERLSEDDLDRAEASSFYCLAKILEGIQDNYIFSQPGIQRMLFRLEELIKRIDVSFHRHLLDQGLQYVQFAFRWFNCFLIREVPLTCVVRLWDTYLSDEQGTGFSQFHVCRVCCVSVSGLGQPS